MKWGENLTYPQAEQRQATGFRIPLPGTTRLRVLSCARFKPIITRGAFRMVWVNPREPIQVPEEADDGDPVSLVEN